MDFCVPCVTVRALESTRLALNPFVRAPAAWVGSDTEPGHQIPGSHLDYVVVVLVVRVSSDVCWFAGGSSVSNIFDQVGEPLCPTIVPVSREKQSSETWERLCASILAKCTAATAGGSVPRRCR